MSTTEGRKRRAPGEVERLIIEAAREVFAAKGYAGATTREIAGVAQVHEPMVYRRFGSKAKLFEATVLEPFNRLITEYVDSYRAVADPSDSLETIAGRFITPFYDLLQERRDLVLALVAASQFHDDFSEDGTLLTGLGHLIERLEPLLEDEASSRPLPGIDVPAALRVVVAMIMGTAILGEWLESNSDPVGRERLVKEMTLMSIHGIMRPAGAVTTAPFSEGDVDHLLDRAAEAERRAVRAELELELVKGRNKTERDDA